MKKYLITLLLATMTATLWSSPLRSKLKHNIVIDTDCNESDLRAISILLSHPDITVKAILISEGKLKPAEGIKKIVSILRLLKADKIPIGSSGMLPVKVSLSEILRVSKDEMIIVCLGSLVNIAKAIQNNTELYDKIEEIVWYNESTIPLKGFNYESDRIAADYLINKGIRIDIISNTYRNTEIFDAEIISQCRQSGTNFAKALSATFPRTNSPKKQGQLLSYPAEELVSMIIVNPELFNKVPLKENTKIRYNTDFNIKAVKEVLIDMITGRYKTGHFVAFYGFPANRELFVYDVRQIMDSAIRRYGIEEWKACVMTDEFHGHLGVFSIVGAKMGICAREYFGIGTDLLEINTYAGSKEPYSCMNDGLQVSTGATLGQGTIHLINDTIAKPQAVFTYQNQSILIKLKSEYLKELKSVIDKGVKNYGLEDEGYWNLVRQTSIKYWLEWNRKEIFDLVIL